MVCVIIIIILNLNCFRPLDNRVAFLKQSVSHFRSAARNEGRQPKIHDRLLEFRSASKIYGVFVITRKQRSPIVRPTEWRVAGVSEIDRCTRRSNLLCILLEFRILRARPSCTRATRESSGKVYENVFFGNRAGMTLSLEKKKIKYI